MTQREPKSRAVTTITVIGRSGDRKGTLEITSGNLTYFRSGAKDQTGTWSLQQFIELLEENLAVQKELEKPSRLPTNKDKNDFKIFVTDVEGNLAEENLHVIDATCPLKVIAQERKLEHGALQIDSPSRKPSFGLTWTVRISIQTAIYILDLYVSKWLANKRGESATDRNVTVSKAEFKSLLRRWLAQLGA